MPTSRYFLSGGPHRKNSDAALRDTLMATAGKAVAEDRTVEERQPNIAARLGHAVPAKRRL
jgi:hypothetical protein